MKDIALVIGGALVGGVIGFFAFFWIAGQGFYAMILPGGLIGVGAGLFRNRSLGLAIGCGVAAVALGLFTEWRFAPFAADDSLGYFLAHVHQKKPLKLLMIAVGGVIGFWGPFSQWRREPNRKPKSGE